jgi:hypothetical protein
MNPVFDLFFSQINRVFLLGEIVLVLKIAKFVKKWKMGHREISSQRWEKWLACIAVSHFPQWRVRDVTASDGKLWILYIFYSFSSTIEINFIPELARINPLQSTSPTGMNPPTRVYSISFEFIFRRSVSNWHQFLAQTWGQNPIRHY